MRIRKVKTKNTVQYAIIDDITKNGKRTTYIYENLGTIDKIKLKSGSEDPLEWLDKYVQKLNQKKKEDSLPIIISKDPTRIVEKNIRNSFNIGYIFLQDIYYKLGLDNLCKNISEKHKFLFDLNDIL